MPGSVFLMSLEFLLILVVKVIIITKIECLLLTFTCVIVINSQNNSMGRYLVFPFLQIRRKLRHREIKELDQSYIVCNWWSWN